MAVSRIFYDPRDFTSAEQCLSEIADRLERGWGLCQLTARRGHLRAVFSRHESPGDERSLEPAGGGR